MAIGPIELQGTIARTQDFSTVKQNTDHKGIVDQGNLQNQFNKEIKERPHQVIKKDNADYHNKKQDAKEKGSNQYFGDGGSNREHKKRQEDGKVVIKGQNNFDIKI